MKKTILTLTVLIISIFNLLAQTEATTENGKKVILKNDGTWTFKDNNVTKISTSYDCNEYMSVNVDKVTGETSISGKGYIIVSENGGKSGFSFILMKSGNDIIMSVTAVGAGSCIDDDDKMNILFRDGTRITIINNGDFNCESRFLKYFGSFGGIDKLEMLRTKEIETMRVWTSNGYVEEDFTKENSIKIMRTIDCLISN